MHIIKRRYVDTMQALGHGLDGLGGSVDSDAAQRASDPYGWRRWFASLFAIYETDRMIALDLPWWNVAATREIADFLAARGGNARVFEYGSGASTVWLARRCGEIVTVEHDKPWLDKFQRQTAGFDNVSLLYRPIDESPAAYVEAIDEFDGAFDLIVIDGRHRSACLKHAENRLKPGGIVLFDDSGRSRYRDAIEGSALNEHRHYGRSYCVPYPDYTSLMRHDG
ncbi:O-methyltransferase [Erythrobacter sp. JK5]|uniref:O-methyltransferase n=1 Tax=Erythrobacter sp. JK5 TaxID=2829500 RepID=UPI001BAB6432|nr:class I SAM-dependent methyltransferase [Erythrobacter sp. JK5]QUL36435.1 class I SAM-dependent methyltransferase [Erythrobacter sp. JK5]